MKKFLVLRYVEGLEPGCGAWEEVDHTYAEAHWKLDMAQFGEGRYLVLEPESYGVNEFKVTARTEYEVVDVQAEQERALRKQAA